MARCAQVRWRRGTHAGGDDTQEHPWALCRFPRRPQTRGRQGSNDRSRDWQWNDTVRPRNPPDLPPCHTVGTTPSSPQRLPLRPLSRSTKSTPKMNRNEEPNHGRTRRHFPGETPLTWPGILVYKSILVWLGWYAPVAQLDRASDFESAGRRFESCRAYQRQPVVRGPLAQR
jgi:hypothetical protein